MAWRWKVLIAVGLTITVLDQWTKFLAVKHLTNGFAQVHFGGLPPASDEAQRAAVADLGFAEEVSLFLRVNQPCRSPYARCRVVTVIDGFWDFRYAENPGAAWSMLASASEEMRRPFLLLVSSAAIIFIIFYFRRLTDDQRLLVASLSLVFGGAIGNLIDRAHLRYVIDFIHWFYRDNHWPTFNVADAAISSGVCLLLLDSLRARKDEKEKTVEAAPKAKSEGEAAG